MFERILPSVQHNIVNILRQREVERRTKEMDKTPERLQKDQERLKKKEELEKIRKTKNKAIKQKLLDALKDEEEARLLHEQDLDEQVPEGGAVERTEPATGEHKAPKPTPEDLKKLPKHYQPQPEEQELADIEDLTSQEEKKIEELHDEHKPHLHKGLPYEEEETEE